MKWLSIPKTGRNVVIFFALVLMMPLLLVACGGEDSETAVEADDQSGQSGLQEQQLEDVILDPEALAVSNTVFDPSITDPETLFVAYCAKCHGLEGLGNGPAAGSLRSVGEGMTLTILQDRSDEEIFNIITGGKGAEMPPWGLVLTEEQRTILVGYVRTLGNE
jgi:mono/diheme cytochrome c family protein